MMRHQAVSSGRLKILAILGLHKRQTISISLLPISLTKPATKRNDNGRYSFSVHRTWPVGLPGSDCGANAPRGEILRGEQGKGQYGPARALLRAEPGPQ